MCVCVFFKQTFDSFTKKLSCTSKCLCNKHHLFSFVMMMSSLFSGAEPNTGLTPVFSELLLLTWVWNVSSWALLRLLWLQLSTRCHCHWELEALNGFGQGCEESLSASWGVTSPSLALRQHLTGFVCTNWLRGRSISNIVPAKWCKATFFTHLPPVPGIEECVCCLYTLIILHQFSNIQV